MFQKSVFSQKKSSKEEGRTNEVVLIKLPGGGVLHQHLLRLTWPAAAASPADGAWSHRERPSLPLSYCHMCNNFPALNRLIQLLQNVSELRNLWCDAGQNKNPTSGVSHRHGQSEMLCWKREPCFQWVKDVCRLGRNALFNLRMKKIFNKLHQIYHL